ncbi:DUF2264 domain-containing protein [Micromonospora deserti]|uniref:DUF2264 domain-containing protein n=1 Tax=Micromonospora deserti TaxID=2070366 RepID=A0A2W2CQR0_9ACTN|nr:DUF2264 domain-containing protein [Micromonospora deserti]PZG01806.1 hypothetical protein C1I99_05590 [Micromonospora deserti]
MRFPAENWRLSRYTGWTRAHWEMAADETLAAVRRFASARHALIDLPGPVSAFGGHSDGLEGFARTFLAAGFRLVHGGDGGLAQWYAEGIAAGVDPNSPERWPSLEDVPQARVEAASIALAMHESRSLIWDALDDRVRQQVVEWLAQAVGLQYPASNWVWFQNITEAFLRSVNGPWLKEDIDRNIEMTEAWYRRDGWYTDGVGAGRTTRKFDWYAGWAMNFYPLWYCRMSAEHAEPALWARYRERLRAYLDGAQHLFGANGSPLLQGRSLTYRFATTAPFWAGALFDATPLPPGRTRRLASGTLRHFVAKGGWDAQGLQPIGWHHAFEPIRQPYSGPGSPYWSSKGFAGLVLPADHPVWTDPEEPLEVEERDMQVTLHAPGWLVSGTKSDGVVRVVNHGSDAQPEGTLGVDDPNYARHAYSTHTGPGYAKLSREAPVDNHVALIDASGSVSHRRPLAPMSIAGRIGVSRHRAHWPDGPMPDAFVWPPEPPQFRVGPLVTTASVLRGAVEIRVVRVEEDCDCLLRVGGFQVDGAAGVDGGMARVVRKDGLASIVIGLRGLAEGAVIATDGADVFSSRSAVPVVTSRIPLTVGEIYAAAVILTGAALPEVLPRIDVNGDEVSVAWADGQADVVSLPPV